MSRMNADDEKDVQEVLKETNKKAVDAFKLLMTGGRRLFTKRKTSRYLNFILTVSVRVFSIYYNRLRNWFPDSLVSSSVSSTCLQLSNTCT